MPRKKADAPSEPASSPQPAANGHARDDRAYDRDEASDATIILATETMAGDIRDFILDRLKHEHDPLPWNMRGEEKQRETIDRVSSATAALVRKAVAAIASDGRRVIKGEVEKVVVKDGIQAVVRIMQSDPRRHDLVDSQGQSILLVVADARVFEGTRGDVKIMPDQKDLGIGDEYGEAAV